MKNVWEIETIGRGDFMKVKFTGFTELDKLGWIGLEWCGGFGYWPQNFSSGGYRQRKHHQQSGEMIKQDFGENESPLERTERILIYFKIHVLTKRKVNGIKCYNTSQEQAKREFYKEYCKTVPFPMTLF